MGRSYRSKYDIIADILEAAMNGTKKTRIMHMANVNYHSFCKYFNMLLEDGLIAEVKGSDGEIIYRTTEAGIEHLKIFSRFLSYKRRVSEKNSF
ncbi:MAG: winged helix-turn-helix domain-containing protein [Candidatus Bathyarchaeota archaeon]|nr:winged helix-turn-helix domain-containing protein [Candidatus Bathyarchaeota archaeon]